MALHEFLGQRRFLAKGGRRFTVRQPTVRTVAAALSVYPAEILGCRKAYLDAPELYASDVFGAVWAHFMDPARLATVLPTFVDLQGGQPGEIEDLLTGEGGAALAMDCVRLALSLSDIGRIIETMDLDAIVASTFGDQAKPAEPVDDEAEPRPSAMELLTTGLAERFHVDPFTPWEWPYEAVMSLARVILPALYPDPAEGETIFGMSRREWAAKGYTLLEGATH